MRNNSINILNKDIEVLNFPVRIYNACKRNNINLISNLVQKSERDLMRMENIGLISLNKVIETLKEVGLSLNMLNKKDIFVKQDDKLSDKAVYFDYKIGDKVIFLHEYDSGEFMVGASEIGGILITDIFSTRTKEIKNIHYLLKGDETILLSFRQIPEREIICLFDSKKEKELSKLFKNFIRDIGNFKENKEILIAEFKQKCKEL